LLVFLNTKDKIAQKVKRRINEELPPNFAYVFLFW